MTPYSFNALIMQMLQLSCVLMVKSLIPNLSSLFAQQTKRLIMRMKIMSNLFEMSIPIVVVVVGKLIKSPRQSSVMDS